MMTEKASQEPKYPKSEKNMIKELNLNQFLLKLLK